jgi:hypothetical protein
LELLAHTNINIREAEKIVNKALAKESKRNRRRIEKHLQAVDLLDTDLRVKLGPVDALKPKEVRRLVKAANDPRSPHHQRSLDRLHEQVGPRRFAAIVTKGR